MNPGNFRASRLRYLRVFVKFSPFRLPLVSLPADLPEAGP